MTRLFKNIKTKALLAGFSLLWLAAFGAHAKTVARVDSLQGGAFAQKGETTRWLNVGDDIEANTEIYTEEGGRLSLRTFYDQRIALAGSSLLKLNGKTLELKKGHVWVHSEHTGPEVFALQSADSHTQYQQGQAVLSYDPQQGKTQLVALEGQFLFANHHQLQLAEEVRAGQFSLIQQERNEALPRKATLIGEKSFAKIKKLFPHRKDSQVLPADASSSVQRSLASSSPSPKDARPSNDWSGLRSPGPSLQPERKKDPHKASGQRGPQRRPQGRPEIIIIRRGPAIERDPASFSAESFYRHHREALKREEMKKASEQKQKKGGPWRPSTTPSDVELRIFAAKDKAGAEQRGTKGPSRRRPRPPAAGTSKKKAARMPASLSPAPEGQRQFESSLQKHYRRKPRHSRQVRELIQRLKSVDQDYQAEY